MNKMLNVSFYSRIFMHFIERKDFSSLAKMLKHTPRHVTNADKLLAELQPLLAKRKYKDNKDLLLSLYHLYKLKSNYENAFYVSLKLRDIKIFKFLRKHSIEFPINPIFGKLLRIDAVQATEHILTRHIKGLRTEKIIEHLLDELNQSHDTLSRKSGLSNRQRKEVNHSMHLFLDALF